MSGTEARVLPSGANRSSKPDAASRRFLKALARAGRAVRRGDDFVFGDGATGPRLPALAVRQLASRGLVRLEPNRCTATPETAPYLRRLMSQPDDYAIQHRRIAPGPEGSRRDLSQNVLDRLSRAAGSGFLEAHQVEAGRRVASWGERAQLRQRITMSYDPAQIGGRRGGAGADIADMAAEARKALARVYRDLPRDCAEVVFDVCVFEKGLQTIEAERNWPRRSAKLVLRIGLDRLAQSLGLAAEAAGKDRSVMRDWKDGAFAPSRFE